jgi:hypothetical protein
MSAKESDLVDAQSGAEGMSQSMYLTEEFEHPLSARGPVPARDIVI